MDSLMKTEPDNRMYQQLPTSSGLKGRRRETVSTNYHKKQKKRPKYKHPEVCIE